MLLPTLLKVFPILGPSVVKAATNASAMSAAINPYSIAVAPDSSATNFFTNFANLEPLIHSGCDNASRRMYARA
jgi:hypothetical protein